MREPVGQLLSRSCTPTTMYQQDKDSRIFSQPLQDACRFLLSIDLCARYGLRGEVEDLNEVILLDREATGLHPPGYPDRSTYLSNLPVRLGYRCNLPGRGRVRNLNEGILLDRVALAFRPPDHPQWSSPSNNLTSHLCIRYDLRRRVEDLDEAILFNQEALALHPLGDPERSTYRHSLAIHLCDRYSLLCTAEDLDEVILLNRYALALRPPGHPERLSSLTNIALHLGYRYNLRGKVGTSVGRFNLTEMLSCFSYLDTPIGPRL